MCWTLATILPAALGTLNQNPGPPQLSNNISYMPDTFMQGTETKERVEAWQQKYLEDQKQKAQPQTISPVNVRR